MNTTGKDINASSTLTDTDHTQKRLILRSIRKAKQFVAFGLLLLAGALTTPVAAQTTTTVDICDRTDLVEAAILAAIPANPACGDVTSTQLADITGTLNLPRMSISTLQSGDFAGLSGLTQLSLRSNSLTELPAGVFDSLTSLTQLSLDFNSLAELPAGVFDSLTSLTTLNLRNNSLTELPAGVFDSLTSLTTLNLRNNSLTELPAGVFDSLTSLTLLFLTDNAFTTPLPADIFNSISSADIRIELSPIGELPGVALTVGGTTTINVTNAFISRNGISNSALSFSEMSNDAAVATVMESSGVVTITGVAMGTTTVSVTADDSVSSTVTRDIAVTVVGTGILAFDAATGNTIATPIVAEASGTDTFYVQLASAPASDVTLTLTSSDTSEGTVMPGTLTFTAAGGATPWNTRQAVTVTAVDDGIVRDDSFTVGFAIATAGDGDSGDYTNSLTIPGVTVTVTDDDVAASICDRTMAVQTVILAAIPSSPACADVTESQLAAITGLSLRRDGIMILRSGDLAGLSGISQLDLRDNSLSTLPADIFDDLRSLTALALDRNNLNTLPPGVFDNLTSLTELRLLINSLTALPANLFDNLTSLTSLNLSGNALNTLPPGVFDNLSNLVDLNLGGNALTTLPANAFSGLTSLTGLQLNDNMLTALPDGLFSTLTSLTSLRLQGNTFTTALPANIFAPISGATIQIDLSPIGDLVDIPSLTLGGVATINVANAFISRDSVGDDRTLSYTITPTGTSVASATADAAGVLTITASSTITGVTTIDIVADDSESSTVTRNIAVTVVEVGLAFFEEVDSATGSTEVTSITTGEPDVAATFYVELISAPTADVTVTVMSDDTTEGMITTGASLTFTTGNWNIRQPVTVTGQDDNFIDVDTSYNITLASTSSDANYNALTETLSATNTDDDVVVDICSRTAEVQTAILNAISPSPTCSTVTESQLAAITGTLDLFSAGISVLSAGDFAGLAGLTELDLFGNSLSALPDNIFNDLTSLTELDLGINLLSALPTGVFNDLTSLTELGLNNNSLSALPAGVFDGLTSLTDLQLQNNTFTTPLPANLFDPLPDAAVIQIDLSPIGDLADIPSLTLGGVATINVANAFISRDSVGDDRTLSYTITPTGTSVASATESSGVLTITASSTITGVTTIDIVADDSVSSTVTRDIAVTVTDVVDICARTTQVQTAILAAISPSPTCSTVTATELAAITGTLDLSNMGISALLAGDFAGLTSLTRLNLDNNTITAIDANTFSGLTSLTRLDLNANNTLTTIDVNAFSGLTSLTRLDVARGAVTAIDANTFSGLTSLTRLDLSSNALTAVPAGVFDGLGSLTDLFLSTNDLTALPENLFSDLTSLTQLWLHNNAFTTPLPANILDPIPSTAIIRIDLSPIGDLPGIPSLSVGGTTTINVANAFISSTFGGDRTITYTATPANTSIATAMESSGVVTITGAGMGTTTVSVLANDGVSGTVGMLTRDIAVTVVEVGISAFDAATGDTLATPIAAENSGTDTFYVQLASAPASDVTLSVMSSDTNEGTVLPATLTFTAAAGSTSWDTRQAVTVTAVPDNIIRDDTFTVDFAVTTGDGGNYPTSLTIPSVTVTVTDDDVPGLAVDIGDGVTTSEGSTASDTFSVVLNTQPTADVTVEISGLDSTEHSLTPSTTLMFTTTNWSTAQTVTLNSVDDNVVDGDQTYDLTLTASGGDYTGVAAQTVSVTNEDDDTAALSIADMSVDEDAGTATLTVTLTSAVTATGTVTVNAMTMDGTATAGEDYTAIASQTLTFTAGSTTQTLDITISDDSIAEGDETFTVMLDTLVQPTGVTTVSITDATAIVTITDDETVPTTIDLSVSPSTIAETAGATDITVTATLGDGSASLPTDTVVTLTVSGTATINTDYTLTMPISTITIAASATSATKTFMIDPIDDSTTEGEETVIISGTATINGSPATFTSATLIIIESSDEDQQAIEQTVAAQASGITQVVTEQIGIRLVSRVPTSSSGGSTQDRQSLSAIDWQDDLAKFTYEGLKRLDSEADMSLDWLLRAAGGNGQLLMPLGAESLTLWATGGGISTKGDGVADYDGDVKSFILGIDTALSNDWLAGIAISYNDSEVDYTMEGTPEANKTEQTLYGIHPYLSRTVSKGLTLWATGGYGFGDVDFSHSDRGQATSDITQWMAAGGLEKQIITNTPWQGALRIKGLWGNAEVDATEYSGGDPIAKVDTDFWRARMESELGYNFPLSGANIRPYAIIGARWDHNDAIVSGDEWHVDVGGGVELSDNAFALNISVRTQVTEGDTEEDSIFATGSLTYDLEQDGQGLQIALSRSLDNTSPAWDSHSFSPLTDTASGLSAAPLTSELAYGWTVHPFGLEGALQTYVQNSFDSSDRHYAVGLELAVNALTLNFETGYHDHTSLNSGETDNTGLESMFKTKIRW